MQPLEITGKCLCEAVSLRTYLVSKSVGACHCDICRTWGGSPLLALDCGNECSFEGIENVTLYPTTQWAERGFCSQCGTHLFIRVKQTNHYILPAGLIDLDKLLVFDHQIFIDKKPEYYAFANNTENQSSDGYFADFS